MGNLGSTSAFYAARPAIKLDGQVNASLSDGLMNVMVV